MKTINNPLNFIEEAFNDKNFFSNYLYLPKTKTNQSNKKLFHSLNKKTFIHTFDSQMNTSKHEERTKLKKNNDKLLEFTSGLKRDFIQFQTQKGFIPFKLIKKSFKFLEFFSKMDSDYSEIFNIVKEIFNEAIFLKKELFNEFDQFFKIINNEFLKTGFIDSIDNIDKFPYFKISYEILTEFNLEKLNWEKIIKTKEELIKSLTLENKNYEHQLLIYTSKSFLEKREEEQIKNIISLEKDLKIAKQTLEKYELKFEDFQSRLEIKTEDNTLKDIHIKNCENKIRETELKELNYIKIIAENDINKSKYEKKYSVLSNNFDEIKLFSEKLLTKLKNLNEEYKKLKHYNEYLLSERSNLALRAAVSYEDLTPRPNYEPLFLKNPTNNKSLSELFFIPNESIKKDSHMRYKGNMQPYSKKSTKEIFEKLLGYLTQIKEGE